MADEAVEEYKSSLSDLTFNSKPLINMLTMLADDSRQHAAQIVQVIEAHIQKAKNNFKLPALYLIDSILKNVQKSTYAQLFAQNIVATFSHVFEKVDEKTRQSLFKLRQTWSTIFPTRKLYAIDVRVNTIDPAWPITAAAPESPVSSIHVNPKFINKEKENEEEKKKSESEEIIEAKMRQQLIEKKAELLKLEQARLDMQLAEARAKLLETRKGPALTSTTPSSTTAPIMKIAETFSAKSTASSSPLSFGAKAPPVTTASSAPSRRDPRLSRDPRMSRDPRTLDASKSSARTATTASVKPASTVHASQHGGAQGSKTHTPQHGFTPQSPKKRPNAPSNLPKIPNVEPSAPSPTSKSAFPSQSIQTAKVAPQTASIPTQPSQSAASTASVMPVVTLPAQATVAPIPTSGAAAAVPLVNQLLSGPQAVELPPTALNLLAQLQQALLQAQVSQSAPQTSSQPMLPAQTAGANQMPGQPIGPNQMTGQPIGAKQTAVGQPMGAIQMPVGGNQMQGQQMGGNQMQGQQIAGHQILGQSLGLNLMAGSHLGSIPMPTQLMGASKYQDALSDPRGSPNQYATVKPPVSSAVPLMSLKTSASDTSIPWHNPPLSHTGQIVLPPSVQELREEAEEEGRFSPGPVDSPRSRSPQKRDIASIPRPPLKSDPRQSKSATALQKKTDLKETKKPPAVDKKRDGRDDKKRDDREDRKRDDREKREGSKESSSGRDSDRDSRNRDSEWRRRDRDLDRYSRSDRDRGRYYSSGRRRSPSPIPRGEGSRRRRTRSRSKSRSPKSSSRSPRGDRTSKTSYDRGSRNDNRSDSRRSTKADEKTKLPKKDEKSSKTEKKDIGEKPGEKKSVIKKEKCCPKKDKTGEAGKDEKKNSDVRSDQKEKMEEMSTMDVDLRKLPKPEPVTEEVSMDVDLRQPSVDTDLVPKTCTYFDEKVEETEPVDTAPNTDVDERIVKTEPPVSGTEDCDLRVFRDIGKTDTDMGKNGATAPCFDEKKSKEERKKALDLVLEMQRPDVDHRGSKSEPAKETPMDTRVEAFQKKDLDLRSPPWRSGSQGDEDFDSRASTPLMDEPSEPPAKKQKKDLDERKPSESTEDTGDLSDLFGGEDVDYRQPPKLKLEVSVPMSQGDLPLESPAKVGWAKFKAKHPEDFCFQQPQDLTPLKTPDAFGSGDVDMRTPPAFPISSGGHTPVLEHQEAILRKAEEQLKNGKITKDQYHEILEQLGELYKLKMIHREMRMTSQATEDGEKRVVANQQEGESSSFPPADVDERRPPAFRIPKKKPEKSKDGAKKERGRKKKGKRAQKDEDEGPKDMDERSMPVLERGMGRRDPPRGILKMGAAPRGILKGGDGARGNPKMGKDNWRNERGEPQGDKQGNQSEHRDEETGDQDMRKSDWIKTMPLAPDGNPYELGRDGWPLFPDGSRVQRGPNGRPDFPLPMPVSLMDLKIKPPPGLRDVDIDAPHEDFDERLIHHNDRSRDDRVDRPYRPRDGPRPDRHDLPGDADWRGGPRSERPMDNDWRKDRPMGVDRRLDQRNDRPGGGDRRPEKNRFMGSHMRQDGLNYLPPHINLKMLERPVTLLDTNQEVVIDQRQIGVKIGAPPRPVNINKKRHYIQVCKQKREVLIDDKPFYRIGDPPADCRLKGYRFKLYFHGPMRRLWIDRVQYDIRLDAPPQKIEIKGEIRDIRANSFDNVLFIDGVSVGQLGQKPKSIKIALTKHELRFDPPPKDIVIDGQRCQLKLNYPVPVIMMRGRPHGICFDGPPRELVIDDQSYMIGMHERKTIRIGKRPHIVGFLGPGHELMIDDLTHEIQFTGEPRDITISNRIHTVSLIGPPPEVKILGMIPVDEKTGRLLFLPGLMADHPPISVSPDSASDSDQDLKGTMQQPIPMVQPPLMPGQQPMMPGLQPMMPGEQPMMPGMSGQQPMMPGQQPMMPMSMSGAMSSQPGQMMPGQMMPLGQVPVSQAGYPMMQTQMMMQNAMMGQQTVMPGFMPASTQQLTMPGVSTLQNVLANVYNTQQGQFMTNPMMNMPGGAGPGAFPGISMGGEQMQSMMGMQQFPGLVPQAPQPAAAPVVDIKDLFSKLVKTGMIIQDEEKKKKEMEERAGKDLYDKEGRIIPVEIGESESLTRVEKIDDLTDLRIPKLKKHHKGVVHRLYLGLQCNSCGVRFIMEEKDKYQEHLDWHFRLNKKEKDEMKIAKFRKWYFDSQDWIDFEEIQDIEDRARKNFFARTHQAIQEAGGSIFQTMGSASEPQQITSCPAASGDSENDDVCEICADPFEQFWDEESEEWHLKDAVRVEGKTYHPVCYEDAKVTLLTATATPMEDGQDPFSTSFSAAATQSLKTEDETAQQPSSSDKEDTPSEVKKEVEDTPSTEEVKVKIEADTSEEPTIKTEVLDEDSVSKPSADGENVESEKVAEEPASTDEMETMEASPGTPLKDEPMEMPESPSLDMAITGSDGATETTEPALIIRTEQSVPVVPKPKPVTQFFGNAIEVVGSQNVPLAVRPFYQEPVVFHVDTLEEGEITD